MSGAVTIRGADTLARTAAGAAAELRDLSAANARVASAIAGAAAPPVRTGRLRASVSTASSATEATVTWPVPYAAIVERRTRFAARALEARTTTTVATYAAAVNQAVGDVRGL